MTGAHAEHRSASAPASADMTHFNRPVVTLFMRDGSSGIRFDPIPSLSIPSLLPDAPRLLEQAGGPQVSLVAVPVEEDEHHQSPEIGRP